MPGWGRWLSYGTVDPATRVRISALAPFINFFIKTFQVLILILKYYKIKFLFGVILPRKGTTEERDLVNKLWERNFGAMRAPASGGATKRPLPDVIAGNGKIYLAIEVKTTTKDKIYIDFPQIDALTEFSRIFGASPYIGVKFKYTKWLFLEPNIITRTKNKNYKIEKSFALEKGLEIDEIIGKEKQLKF